MLSNLTSFNAKVHSWNPQIKQPSLLNIAVKPTSGKKNPSPFIKRLTNISIALSILLGCTLMITGRKEDLLDGIAIAAGGIGLTKLFLGLFKLGTVAQERQPTQDSDFASLTKDSVRSSLSVSRWDVAKKRTAASAKLLAPALSLVALAALCLKISKGLEPSREPSTASLSLPLLNPAYETWFATNKGIIDLLKQMEAPGPALGALQGMFLLEPHMIVRSGWYGQHRFSGDPKDYGFDVLNADSALSGKHPVLLLPGAIGTWHYLGDLATSLKQAGIPVFTIDLGAGAATNEKLKKLNEKIHAIRALYQSPPSIDIVAHSMGANLGLALAYDEESTFIDAEGNLAFQANKEIKANQLVGRIVTLANPLITSEVESLKNVGKIDHFFNIIAKYDGIMGHKQPGLVGDMARQAEEVENGHIGIVFDSLVHQKIIQKLSP